MKRIILAMVALLAFAAIPAGAQAATAGARSRPVDPLCNSSAAFPNATGSTRGNITLDNRQLSVYMVLCAGFGRSAKFAPGGAVFCTLLADAIGNKFPDYRLFADGACALKDVASHEAISSVACAMLGDLAGEIPIPEIKAYAFGGGIACALGRPLGTWIEEKSEKHAAEAVWHKHDCLKFVTHHFPRTDDWFAVPCRPGDRGFSDLQRVHTTPAGGGGIITPSGRVGPLRIDHSGRGAVIAFAGKPDAEAMGSAFGGPRFDALGYECGRAEATTQGPVGHGTYCHTVFYIDLASGTLEQFFTTSRSYSDDHGIRVGMSTGEANRRSLTRAIIGCLDAIHSRTTSANLMIGIIGGHPGRAIGSGPVPVVGGHVELLAVDSNVRNPGVFDCI